LFNGRHPLVTGEIVGFKSPPCYKLKKIIMKNIILLPTKKPSRLYYHNDKSLRFVLDNILFTTSQNIYITSDEEIKEGWAGYAYKEDVIGSIFKHFYTANRWYDDIKEIILTTDQDLIKDGVQAIDDEFLEWFVKNPSCDKVEVLRCPIEGLYAVIPKEEPKQETLEQAAYNTYMSGLFSTEEAFIRGAKWQQERSYSKEEVEDIVNKTVNRFCTYFSEELKFKVTMEWFEQFKKK
jgi:hypothetical protein